MSKQTSNEYFYKEKIRKLEAKVEELEEQVLFAAEQLQIGGYTTLDEDAEEARYGY